MSTCSANTTALADRRHFLSTLAGAGALSLPVLPAMAWTPGPIEAMWPEHLRLEAEFDAACERTWDAEERYEEPEQPRWHPWTAEGGYKLEKLPGNKCHCYLNDSDENIAKLRAIIDEPFVFDPTFAVVEVQHQDRVERAKKTLSQIEAWQAEVTRRKDAAGLTKAEAEEEAARSAAHAHRAAIVATKANTLRDLGFQAAFLSAMWGYSWSEEAAPAVLDRLAELTGVSPRAAA